MKNILILLCFFSSAAFAQYPFQTYFGAIGSIPACQSCYLFDLNTGLSYFGNKTPAWVAIGTVDSIAVANAHGVSATITNPTTNPLLTFTLGNVTPGSVNASGLITANASILSGDQTSAALGTNIIGSIYASGIPNSLGSLRSSIATTLFYNLKPDPVNANGFLSSVSTNTYRAAISLGYNSAGSISYLTAPLSTTAIGTSIIPTEVFRIWNNGQLTSQFGGAYSAKTSVWAEFNSTTQGITIPTMTATQMNAISVPVTGLLVYNTTANDIFRYNGTTWNDVGLGGTVTSITLGYGFTPNTPITTSGSMVIDTTKVCSIYALADSSLIWHTALLDSALALRAMTTSLTGDVTGSGNGSFATTISSHAVTYAKMQTVSANKLLGNPTGSTANVSEIGLGSNMTIFSGNLTKYIPSTNVNSDYTASNNDELILAEPTGSNITITLPTTGIVAGKSFIVKGVNASPTQTVTVTAPTSIDGNVSDTVLTTDNQAICYVFDGTKYWIVSSYNPLPPIYGSSTQSGDGTTTSFTIAHGLGATPTWYNVVPTSSAAANIAYITADATNITVHYTVAPALGTNNLTYNFQAKQ